MFIYLKHRKSRYIYSKNETTYHSKIPSLKSEKFIENFFINKNLKFLVELSKKKTLSKSNDS